MPRKIVLITGANAGIGLALAERLLETAEGLQLILACRNLERAEKAKDLLAQQHSNACIDIVQLDTSSQASIYRAAQEIRGRYKRLDYLFLNAGIMPVSSVNWKAFRECFFSSKIVHTLTTGDGMVTLVDGTTEDGLRTIFATNLFGHFTLFQELEDLMGKFGSPTQVIWTSSSNAKASAFSMDDFQHKNGTDPYSSSKYATDMLSVALNDKFNKKGIYSHTTCPGLVMTNLTYGILPNWFWTLVFPFLWFMRLFTNSLTITAFTAAEVLLWLFKQSPMRLDPLMKYHSHASVTGRRFVTPVKMNIQPETALEFYDKLCQLKDIHRARFKSSVGVK